MLKTERYLKCDEKREVQKTEGEAEPMQVEDNQQTNDKDEDEFFDWKLHYIKFDSQDHKQKLDDALAVIKLENDKLRADSDKFDKEIDTLNKEIEQIQKDYEVLQQIEEQQEEEALIQPRIPLQQQGENEYQYSLAQYQNQNYQSAVEEYLNEQTQNLPSNNQNISPNTIPQMMIPQQNNNGTQLPQGAPQDVAPQPYLMSNYAPFQMKPQYQNQSQ